MSADFHLFPSLPKEIQDLIWDAAVRPVPGSRHVHRFLLVDHYFNFYNPASTRNPFPGDFVRFGRQEAPLRGFSLVVPWCALDGSPNDSVYALDSGLWMTCTASRAAMNRRFQKNEWWSQIAEQNDGEFFAPKGTYSDVCDIPHSALYIDREKRTTYITIGPEDLIHLDSRHLDSVDWFHHYAGDHVPLIDYKYEKPAVKGPSFLGLNIAVDYDPRMLDTLAGRPVHYCRRDLGMSSMSLVDMVDVLHESAKRTLWFIDYRLAPLSPSTKASVSTGSTEKDSPGAPESQSASNKRQQRQAFYSGESMLIEVKREEMPFWTINTAGEEPEAGKRSVFEFFDLLVQESNGRLDIEDSDRLRVLSCQSASGQALRSMGPLANDTNESCPVCHPTEEVRRARPVKVPVTASDDADDVWLTGPATSVPWFPSIWEFLITTKPSAIVALSLLKVSGVAAGLCRPSSALSSSDVGSTGGLDTSQSLQSTRSAQSSDDAQSTGTTLGPGSSGVVDSTHGLDSASSATTKETGSTVSTQNSESTETIVSFSSIQTTQSTVSSNGISATEWTGSTGSTSTSDLTALTRSDSATQSTESTGTDSAMQSAASTDTASASETCADACVRAVYTTTLVPASSALRLANCNPFIRSTEIPEASTVYITQTVYSTVAEGEEPTNTVAPGKRDKEAVAIEARDYITVKNLPAYASVCSDAAAYISACECIGATVSTYVEDPATITSIVSRTSYITLQGDSPPRLATENVDFPEGTDWTRTYDVYEVPLPTFTDLPEEMSFPPPPIDPECLLDPEDGGEFPGPPEPPSSEAEGRLMYESFNPPLYKFEKPSDGPAGLYDLVMVGGGSKPYIAINVNTGEVVSTSSSTQGAQGFVTTVFGVSCKGYMTVQHENQEFVWKGASNDEETIVAPGGPSMQGIVALPNSARTQPSEAADKRRSYATEGRAPLCPNAPHYVISYLKAGARGNNPNGCGPANGIDVVPDWNFGRCCDEHDNCFDNCGVSFEHCNSAFHSCMRGKCWDAISWWFPWLYFACLGMSDWYNFVVSSWIDVNAFYTANKERCECSCPLSSSPVPGITQSWCPVNGVRQCIPTGGDDSLNCGGCKRECHTEPSAPADVACAPRSSAATSASAGTRTLAIAAEVINQYYPTEGVTNGAFDDEFNGWHIKTHYGTVNADASSGTVFADVRVCPGVAYELDFMLSQGMDHGNQNCLLTVKVGPRVLLDRKRLVYAHWTTMGPFPVAAFNEGDPGASKGQDFALHTKLAIAFTCTFTSYFRWDDVSLHAA
ncbi:hypothetical protein ACJZ2D_011157 [Fusarium nematophilum]